MSDTAQNKRFCTPKNPAPDINALINYLEEESRGGEYIYRGQVKEWGAPLLPSLYRNFVPLKKGVETVQIFIAL